MTFSYRPTIENLNSFSWPPSKRDQFKMEPTERRWCQPR